MDNKTSKKVKKSLLFQSLSLAIILIFTQCNESYKIELAEKTATLSGKIENYDGVFKSGKLLYFDAIGRMEQDEIFLIDSSGSFKVDFNIPHPIYNSVYMEVQGNYYAPFLEPGKDIQVKIVGDSIAYPGDEDLPNNQLVLLENHINSELKKEIEHCRFLHTTNIEYKDYIKEEIKLSNDKLRVIDKYAKTHKLNKSVLNAIKKEAYFVAAHSWMCFRYDYSNGQPQLKDTLPANFYKDLFKQFPINDINALSCRHFSDYIANIKSVFADQKSSGAIIDFIKNANTFSDEELIMIEGNYNHDTIITHSDEFKQFYKVNGSKLRELFQRSAFNNVLNSCKKLPKGIGRDLVISQGMCTYYFKHFYIAPTEEEWDRLGELIETKFVLNNLLNINNSFMIDIPANSESAMIQEHVKKNAESTKDQLIGKFKGKVVYVDFYTVWCSPCKQEIPYSKMLIEQFKNKDVVFLFLCCQSKKESWEKLVAHDQLGGEHYLLNKPEYHKLSTLYNVKGFPTYVLIDKEGKLVSNNAPRPSSRLTIINEINKLLE
jgi:thiol-disulfide isomerase/thioredoxin